MLLESESREHNTIPIVYFLCSFLMTRMEIFVVVTKGFSKSMIVIEACQSVKSFGAKGC